MLSTHGNPYLTAKPPTLGGGRRPLLNWTQGEAITYTRLTTIPETLKVASLPSDYETFARGVKYDDNFIRELVNLGWPLRFAHSIDSSVLRFLQLERAYGKTGAGASRTGGSQEIIMFSGSVSRDIIPKSILVDSGAQISCVRESAVDLMTQSLAKYVSLQPIQKRQNASGRAWCKSMQ
jgi:hypothetical protein